MWPLKHFRQFLNTAKEWHAAVIGFCYPALKLWRVDTDIDKEEFHYFAGGLLAVTIAIILIWRKHANKR